MKGCDTAKKFGVRQDPDGSRPPCCSCKQVPTSPLLLSPACGEKSEAPAQHPGTAEWVPDPRLAAVLPEMPLSVLREFLRGLRVSTLVKCSLWVLQPCPLPVPARRTVWPPPLHSVKCLGETQCHPMGTAQLLELLKRRPCNVGEMSFGY